MQGILIQKSINGAIEWFVKESSTEKTFPLYEMDVLTIMTSPLAHNSIVYYKQVLVTKMGRIVNHLDSGANHSQCVWMAKLNDDIHPPSLLRKRLEGNADNFDYDNHERACINEFAKVKSMHCLYDNYSKGWDDCIQYLIKNNLLRRSKLCPYCEKQKNIQTGYFCSNCSEDYN